jgi:membrane protein implicated in regulation of membrane protease activity
VTRFFAVKAWLTGAALAVGVAGMATERRWLVWIAVALLAAAFLLRFTERSRGTP